MESCRNKSEKYWSKLAERGVISNYTPVEDVDLENVQVDTIVEDWDEKLNAADLQTVQTLFMPMIFSTTETHALNPADSQIHRTFFLIEKAEARDPVSSGVSPVIVLYDSGSGRSVGNSVEFLDYYPNQQTTEIVLCSLNGMDRS